MGEQVEKIFTWVLKNFSDLQEEPSYSRPFAFAGCNWRCDTKNAASQEKVVDFDVSQDILCLHESKEGVDDDDGASEEGSEDDGASQEGSDDDDDGVSQKGSDDDAVSEEGQNDDDNDASSLVSKDGSREKGSLKEGSLTVGNCGRKCNNVASETEVSNVDYYDDAPIEDPGDDDVIENDQGDDSASSLASGVSDRDVGSLNKFEHASQRADDGNMKCNKVVSVTEASNDFSEEVQPVEETKDVNGFQVFSSQVESVSHIFRRHPDIALGFRPKNQEIRKAYMNELLSLIKMLCQSQRSSPRMF
uniref:MATH domain-containing protein n=1 Tax=Brassica oleracea TaxID=3712 RepID=A0A3P6BR26_BRAOL|nr:unnamed protein product [Brassica oleracea]